MKQAAEELLRIADEIEQDAANVTQFVCQDCNHTATLAKINERRKQAATELGENVSVSDITVNDQIACPACNGVMAYSENEESKAYYFDPEKTAEKVAPKHDETKETPAAEKAESEQTQADEAAAGTELHKEASIDYDSLERYTK